MRGTTNLFWPEIHERLKSDIFEKLFLASIPTLPAVYCIFHLLPRSGTLKSLIWSCSLFTSSPFLAGLIPGHWWHRPAQRCLNRLNRCTRLSTSKGFAPGRLCCIWYLAFRPFQIFLEISSRENMDEYGRWLTMINETWDWGIPWTCRNPFHFFITLGIWLSSLAQLVFTFDLFAWVGRLLSNRFEDGWVVALSTHQRLAEGDGHFPISIRITSICLWRDWSECNTTTSRKMTANIQPEEDFDSRWI